MARWICRTTRTGAGWPRSLAACSAPEVRASCSGLHNAGLVGPFSSTNVRMFDLGGKAAVVTGAGSGIGAAIARLFAVRGARVAAIDVDAAAAERTVYEIRTAGGQAHAFGCDVGEAGEVRAAFERVKGTLQRVDILVNNAGIAHVGDLQHTFEEDLDRLYRVNVKG